MYPFERFTDEAKRALTLAQEEAERSRGPYIGTEHLLLGILVEADGGAAHVLANTGVTVEKVREQLSSEPLSREVVSGAVGLISSGSHHAARGMTPDDGPSGRRGPRPGDHAGRGAT